MSWAERTNAPPRLKGKAAVERRLRVLRQYPLCYVCKIRASVIADHIVNLARGGADHESNMAGICHRCHNRKTATESWASRRKPRSRTQW